MARCLATSGLFVSRQYTDLGGAGHTHTRIKLPLDQRSRPWDEAAACGGGSDRMRLLSDTNAGAQLLGRIVARRCAIVFLSQIPARTTRLEASDKPDRSVHIEAGETFVNPAPSIMSSQDAAPQGLARN